MHNYIYFIQRAFTQLNWPQNNNVKTKKESYFILSTHFYITHEFCFFQRGENSSRRSPKLLPRQEHALEFWSIDFFSLSKTYQQLAATSASPLCDTLMPVDGCAPPTDSVGLSDGRKNRSSPSSAHTRATLVGGILIRNPFWWERVKKNQFYTKEWKWL